MEIRVIYKKLQKFTASATGLVDKQIIFANQMGKKPIKPFITIDLRTIKQVGTPLIKRVDEDGIESTVLLMQATVTFQCFSGTLFEAEDLLSELALKFNTELPNEIFNSELARRKVLKEVTAFTTIIDSQPEHRAVFEIEIIFNELIVNEVGLITVVELKNLIR